MTKFLKLTRHGTKERILINIKSIRQIVSSAVGGSRIYFSDDPKYGQTTVAESFETIEDMIRNEEVVR